MAAEKTSLVLPPPPPNRQKRALVAIGVLAAAAVALGVAQGEVLLVVASLSGAGALFWLLAKARRIEVGGHLALAALDRASRGRFDEAEALLAAVPTNVHRTYVGQMVFSQRAAIALYEGRLDDAIGLATTAAREGKRLNATERIHQGSALSIRAVAHAGLGHRDEALRDAKTIREAQFRQAGFVARVALAEALLFAREKDMEGLARVIREERPLLFGATGPRERLVARALARMIAAKKVSVYREAAKRDDEELDEQASWVAKIAPGAASYARAAKLGGTLEAPATVTEEARAAAEKAGPTAKSPWRRVVALWVVLIVLFLAIWQFLTPDPHAAPAPVHHDTMPFGLGSIAALYVGVLLAAGLFIAYRIAIAKRITVALGNATETRLRGNLDEARDAFTELAKNKIALVAPQAHRELATIATMHGAFREAQAHAEAGIAAAASSAVSLSLSRPVLLPLLHGELAIAFAAEGRVARAEEELEKIRTGFPTYPYLARDTFRTRLFAAAASNRLDEAAELSRSRPVDLPLTMDEELLCDVLRVHAGDRLPEGERERIEADVRDDPRAAKLLDRLVPTLRASAFERGPRIAYEAEEKPYSEPPTSDEEAAEAAEEEARAKKALPLPG